MTMMMTMYSFYIALIRFDQSRMTVTKPYWLKVHIELKCTLNCCKALNYFVSAFNAYQKILHQQIIRFIQLFLCVMIWSQVLSVVVVSWNVFGHFWLIVGPFSSSISCNAAVPFLTRTFRYVLYVCVGKLIVRLWRSQRSRTVVWGGSRRDGSWKMPVTPAAGAGATPTAAAGAGVGPAGTKTKPQLEPATSTGVILPETGQFLLLCSL